jgi:hypothetical protein
MSACTVMKSLGWIWHKLHPVELWGITTDVVALLLSRCPTKMRLTVVAEMLPTTTPQPTQ